jgi:hypothetical protein
MAPRDRPLYSSFVSAAAEEIFRGATMNKLLPGIRTILLSDPAELRDVAYVQRIIENIGLYNDRRREAVYGDDVAFMNPKEGLWQIPRQLAEALVYTSARPIQTFLEVGTFLGWTTAVITAYLLRFNRSLQVTTIDPNPFLKEPERDLLCNLLPVRYLAETSDKFAGQSFDFCFIDADHGYACAQRDYQNVGRHAPVCWFHDTHDHFVETQCEGHGVPAFWRDLQRDEKGRSIFAEFTHHSRHQRVMGIGVRVKNSQE